MSQQAIYYRNPVVSCRPEEPEGGILYNPADDTVELINMTGLMIWRLVDGTTIEETVQKLKEMFTEISEEALKEDVTDFILLLVSKNFIKKE